MQTKPHFVTIVCVPLLCIMVVIVTEPFASTSCFSLLLFVSYWLNPWCSFASFAPISASTFTLILYILLSFLFTWVQAVCKTREASYASEVWPIYINTCTEILRVTSLQPKQVVICLTIHVPGCIMAPSPCLTALMSFCVQSAVTLCRCVRWERIRATLRSVSWHSGQRRVGCTACWIITWLLRRLRSEWQNRQKGHWRTWERNERKKREPWDSWLILRFHDKSLMKHWFNKTQAGGGLV